MAVTIMGLDPVEFMKRYRVQLAYMGGPGQTAPIDDCVAGAVANSKEYPSGQRYAMEVIIAGNAATLQLSRQTRAYDTHIRYLPWEPNVCTYMIMDAQASMAFTGPLTGCNIYVAGPRNAPVLFHTNSNLNAGNPVQNNTDKRTLALNLLATNVLGLPANTLIGGQLERASYSGSFLGFVFGVKDANDWKFYFNGIGAGSSVVRRIF